jgi:small nuclear ribonucleoprotein (snRNP)-like protein
MNLILSDVEETIMIVGEGADGTVNVRPLILFFPS